MQNRFKSPVVWTAIVAQIISIGQLSGLWAKLGLDVGTIGDITAAVIQLAVIIGILNNPTDGQKF